MHIAIFIYCLRGGGAQRRTLTIARGFAERGHHVDMVVVSRDESAAVALPPGIRLVGLDHGWRHWFEWLNRHLGLRGLFTWGALPVLVSYLRRERPDVFMPAANHVNLVGLIAARFARTRQPIVVRVSNHPSGNLAYHRPLQRRLRVFLRWVARRAYRWADAAIAVSQGVADDLRDLARLPASRVTTIYNPVVTQDLIRSAAEPLAHPWLAPGSPPLVLGVGTLKRQKDFPTLLRAFARIHARRPAHLVILGEGRERAELERLIDELGLNGDVALPGWSDNPYTWMSRASVMVLSSAWEGLPGVLIEAMACGCPVVSTNCPSGPREILESGVLGPLVRIGDDGAMATAIEHVLDHPPDRRLLRERAASFSEENAIDRYLEVLRGQVAARARARHREEEDVADTAPLTAEEALRSAE